MSGNRPSRESYSNHLVRGWLEDFRPALAIPAGSAATVSRQKVLALIFRLADNGGVAMTWILLQNHLVLTEKSPEMESF